MPRDSYDYKLRALIDDEPLESYQGKAGDHFAWYEGEVIVLEVKHKDHTLLIKLDEKGNVSLKRSINQRKQTNG